MLKKKLISCDLVFTFHQIPDFPNKYPRVLAIVKPLNKNQISLKKITKLLFLFDCFF